MVIRELLFKFCLIFLLQLFSKKISPEIGVHGKNHRLTPSHWGNFLTCIGRQWLDHYEVDHFIFLGGGILL